MHKLIRRIRRLNVHHRLALGALTGAVAYLFLMQLSTALRILATWDVSAGTYLLLAWLTMIGTSSEDTRISTQTLRQSGVAVMWGVLVATLISMASLVFLFKSSQKESPGLLLLHVGLTFLALGFSWLLIHTRFAFHYAHSYYNVSSPQATDADGGLNFPGGHAPDYLDFAYFSFVVGMTSQVSDVVVTSQNMRRLVMVHGLLAFGFNVVVVALSVNIFASLLA
jgi:uncharacterized membrane protein